MGTRQYKQNQSLKLLSRVVTLYPVVTVGAGGAVTLKKRSFAAMGSGSVAPSFSLTDAPTTGNGYAVGDGAGVRSVARTGTGAWTITLSDPYQYIIGVRGNTGHVTPTATVNMVVYDTSSTPSTNTALGNGGVILVVWFAATTATDPADGDTCYLEIILGDSSAP